MTKFTSIAAFGSGSGLIDLMAFKPDNVQLVCIADNDASLHGIEIGGVKIVSALELAKKNFDAVIITAAAVDPIRKQLLELGVDPLKIIAINPSSSRRLFEDVNRDIVRLNEGFGINIPEAGIATMYLRYDRDNLKSPAWPIDFVRNQTFNLCAEQIVRNEVSGAIAELGVFRGDQAQLLSHLFPDRTFHLFDTFEGFAEADLATEQSSQFSQASLGDFANTSLDLVLGKLHNPDRVVVHQGFFPATTSGVEDTFAFVSIDVDLHDPTAAGLEWFFPRLSPRGFIFVHDYNNGRYQGVRHAVDKFADKAGAAVVPISDFSGSVVITKL